MDTHTSTPPHAHTHTVKGHIRKGYALLAMRDTVKAMQAFQRALELDPNHAVRCTRSSGFGVDGMISCPYMGPSFLVLY